MEKSSIIDNYFKTKISNTSKEANTLVSKDFSHNFVAKSKLHLVKSQKVNNNEVDISIF